MSSEDSFQIYLTSEEQGLAKLKANAGSSYFDPERHFLSALLSQDLRAILHIITLKDTKEIYIYDTKTGLYKEFGNETLETKIKYVLWNSYSKHNATATIYDIMACTYLEREVFTVPIQFLPVENGVLNISKNPPELLPYSEKFFFTYQLPVSYNPEAKCPKFLKFLSEILPEEKYRKQIQEMFGWCLQRDYDFQYAFFLVGDGGNGKSKLLNVLAILLGKGQNVSAISLQQLCEHRFMTAELYQKFANIFCDLPSTKIMDSAFFRALTGTDPITAEKKNKNPFTFWNYAKLIFSTNEIPYIQNKSYAYYRRLMIIFFHVVFGDGGLPKDEKILDRITTPEELSGILNWALEGLQRLKKQGDFSHKISVAETQDYYERLSNPVYTFLRDNIEETEEEDKINFIPKDYLFNEVLDYCKINELLTKRVTKTGVAYAINKYFNYIKSAQRKIGKKERVHVWEKCKFTSERNVTYQMWLDSFKDNESNGFGR